VSLSAKRVRWAVFCLLCALGVLCGGKSVVSSPFCSHGSRISRLRRRLSVGMEFPVPSCGRRPALVARLSKVVWNPGDSDLLFWTDRGRCGPRHGMVAGKRESAAPWGQRSTRYRRAPSMRIAGGRNGKKRNELSVDPRCPAGPPRPSLPSYPERSPWRDNGGRICGRKEKDGPPRESLTWRRGIYAAFSLFVKHTHCVMHLYRWLKHGRSRRGRPPKRR